jgi:hypothetical protein
MAGSLAGVGPSWCHKGWTREPALIVDIHDVLEKLFCCFCFALKACLYKIYAEFKEFGSLLLAWTCRQMKDSVDGLLYRYTDTNCSYTDTDVAWTGGQRKSPEDDSYTDTASHIRTLMKVTEDCSI